MASKAKPPLPAKRPRGAPPKNPALVAEALGLVDRGMLPVEILERPEFRGSDGKAKISQRTIYNAIEKRKRERAAAPKPDVAAPPVPPAPASPEPAPVRAVAPPVPAELQGAARRLWIIRQRIDRVRDALQKADDTLDLGRISSLQGALHDLLKQEAIIEKDAVPDDPAAEERRWERAAASALKKIKAGVQDARERMAALLGRPFPGDADMGAGGRAAGAA